MKRRRDLVYALELLPSRLDARQVPVREALAGLVVRVRAARRPGMVLKQDEAATHSLELPHVFLDGRLVHFGEAAGVEADVGGTVAEIGKDEVWEHRRVAISEWLLERRHLSVETDALVRTRQGQVVGGSDADDGKVVVDVLEGSPAAVEQVVGKSAEAAPDLADDGMLDVVGEVRHSPRVRVVAKAIGSHEGPVHDESHRISDHRRAGIEQRLRAVQVDPPGGVGTEVLGVGGLAEAITERPEEVLQEIVQCRLVVSVEGVGERSEVIGHEVSPFAPDSKGCRDRVGPPASSHATRALTAGADRTASDPLRAGLRGPEPAALRSRSRGAGIG